MKIIIAMDSFKGSLRADQACEIIASAIEESISDVQTIIKPMADGGEGTAAAMIRASGGEWIAKTVMGPLPDMQVQSGFAWFDSDKTALVEMASASGLELLAKEQMNPLETTTYGTGELIKAAAEYGAQKILLAVGGSATVDGGCGAATAVGWRFLDHDENPIPLGGAGLGKIAKIVEPEDLNLPAIEVLCDVDNLLCGEHGAARIYGPQKGATVQMVEQLEKNMLNLTIIVQEQLQRDINNVPGAGAAGGLAAGALAFMNATVVSGIETIMSRSSLSSEMQSADWVITGEGSFDHQSLYGKVVSGISALASKSDTKIAVLAGQVSVAKKEYQKLGIVTATGCKPDDMSLEDAMKNSKPLLLAATQRFAKQYLNQ